MTVDNSRFSYDNPGEYLDRAALAAAVVAVTVGGAATSPVPPVVEVRSGTASGPTEGMEKPRVAQRATTGFRQRVLDEDAGNSVDEFGDTGGEDVDDGGGEAGEDVDHVMIPLG